MSLRTELHYFPCLEYFVHLLPHEEIRLEAWEHYQKQSYRNRCHINTAQGVKALSVPVCEGNRKVLMKDIRIDYGQKWLNTHWRSITSAYGKAPFFIFYEDVFRNILFKKHDFLLELNLELLTNCLKLLGVEKKIFLTEAYVKTGNFTFLPEEPGIHPKTGFETRQIYQPCKYYQVFGKEFAPNLSILDLLFCEGPKSLEIIKRSSTAGYPNK